MNEQIVRRKLSDQVIERLKGMITSGEYKPDDYLPSERELMARFGVGRPAIREALQSLSNMGLIAINHGERSRVLQLTANSALSIVDEVAQLLLSASPETLENLKEARRFFEAGMARMAALKATSADVVELQVLLQRQHAAQGDPAAFIEADMQFHNKLAAISGNTIYEAVSRAMLSWLKKYHTEALIWAGKGEQTLAEHAAIIQAVIARDPDAAEKVVTAHLDRSTMLYVHEQGRGAAQVKVASVAPRRRRKA